MLTERLQGDSVLLGGGIWIVSAVNTAGL